MGDKTSPNDSIFMLKHDKYECPIHGVHDCRMIFHPTPYRDTEVSFCTDCLHDKFIEVGVPVMTKVEVES